MFGFALLAMSQGAYALGQGWVLGGLALFAAVALVGEGVLWPAEQRLQAALAPGDAAIPLRPENRSTATPRPCPGRAVAVLVLLVAGTVAHDRPALTRERQNGTP